MNAEMKKTFYSTAAHLSGLCGVGLSYLDLPDLEFLYADSFFCTGCGHEKCDPARTHDYGINESFRWSGRYIYYCPLGLTFAASPCLDENSRLCGGIVCGPVIMGDPHDTITAIPGEKLRSKATALPKFSAQRVTDLSHVLQACAVSMTRMGPGALDIFSQNPENIMKSVYDITTKSVKSDNFYPIEYEKQLHTLIVEYDKSGAQALINELLGHIYFSSNYDLNTIKARVIELLVLLSRANIDAGADVREIFSDNNSYLNDIDRVASLEELNVWLSSAIRRFVNYTFDFTQVKHSDVVHKAMDYIRRHYSEKISLDDIAKHVYLSRSYLSKIFKEETGYSITDYIKRVRIAKSKLFLLDNKIKVADIAEICGFEDQSYFTKVFKSETGLSPKKYRDQRGRI